MLCPECNKELISKADEIYLCPQGDGSLITGGTLQDVRSKKLIPEKPEKHDSHDSSRTIVCPNCNEEMPVIDYNLTGIMIDTCTNCQYRWLDAGELHKIAVHEPDLSADDLLFLHDLDQKVHENRKSEAIDPNPRLKGFNAARVIGPIVTSEMSGNDSKISTITGVGILGIIKGLFHSKRTAYLVLTVLIIAAIGYYLIFRFFGFL